MSVISCDVVNTTQATWDATGPRTYEVLYRVITDNQNDNAIAAIRASGIPKAGNYYSVGNDYDNGAFARQWNATLQAQDDDRKTWNVTVHFASATGKGGDNQHDPMAALYEQEYPWLAPARVSMNGVDREEQTKWMYANYDSTSRTEVKTSAGETVVDYFTVPQATAHLTIEKDYRTLPTSFVDYINRVNSTTFFGKPRGWWRLLYPRVVRLFSGSGMMYFNVVYDFEYADNNVRVIDRGWFSRDPDATSVEPTVASDGYGRVATEPVKLDGLGFQLSDWEDGVEFPPGGVYRHQEIDFTGLSIPKDWTDKA